MSGPLAALFRGVLWETTEVWNETQIGPPLIPVPLGKMRSSRNLNLAEFFSVTVPGPMRFHSTRARSLWSIKLLAEKRVACSLGAAPAPPPRGLPRVTMNSSVASFTLSATEVMGRVTDLIPAGMLTVPLVEGKSAAEAGFTDSEAAGKEMAQSASTGAVVATFSSKRTVKLTGLPSDGGKKPKSGTVISRVTGLCA
ncbi:MAG: hypothetical protein OXU83_04475 [Gammaproteobacteria bacterium]|nr:hypothetical protein [Gammaproteobacteria bacterium]